LDILNSSGTLHVPCGNRYSGILLGGSYISIHALVDLFLFTFKIPNNALSRKSYSLAVQPLFKDGFNLLHPAVLHNIQVNCTLESKIIEGQKIDKGIFHIKEKMKKEPTKHLGWMNKDCYGSMTVLLCLRIEGSRTN
jgi:hypothetical protein